ncbi:MTH865 family protein [Halarchaeum salinum]|uniref:MTH865 family protein n=1 Tax=Halarchaeum salinum TaxID=489912 RepID=A0AAV3SB01_9EURY
MSDADTDAEAELREELTDALADADYPVTSMTSLVPELPKGPMTTFHAGERSFSAMELAKLLSGHEEFPYDDVESLVDDVLAGLKAEGEL